MFRYGAVVRGTNAYVPPGARRSGAMSPPVTNAAKPDIPKVAVNGPDGTAVAAPAQASPSSSKTHSPAPTSNPNKVIHVVSIQFAMSNELYKASRGSPSSIPRLRHQREATIDSETSGIGEKRDGQTHGGAGQVQPEFQG